MRLTFPSPLRLNLHVVLTRAGYHRSADGSYIRRLGRSGYPRFHVHSDRGFLSLHLDQKAASYPGVRRHSGEYSGELVEAEADRLRGSTP